MHDGIMRMETNIDYRGPVNEFLGRSYSDDAGNSGQEIEYRTTLTSEPTFVDFDGNGTPGEGISGSGRSVRIQENTDTFDGKTTSSVKYFDAATGALLGGANTADGYVTVVGSDGYPTGEIYDPNGNKQTMAGILKLDQWTIDPTALNDWVTANNKGTDTQAQQISGFIDYLLTEATTQFFQENVDFEDIIQGSSLVGGKLEGSNYTLELTGSFTVENPGMPNESIDGTITSGRMIKDGVDIAVGNNLLNLPAELIQTLFDSVAASAAPPFEVIAASGSGIIEVINSSVDPMMSYQIKAIIIDEYGNELS